MLRPKIKVAVMEGRAETREYVSELLAQSPNLSVEALSDDMPTLRSYDVLLLGLDTKAQEWLAAIKPMLAQTPTCGVIVFGGAATINVLPQAMAVGARRFLPYPFAAATLSTAIAEVHEEV